MQKVETTVRALLAKGFFAASLFSLPFLCSAFQATAQTGTGGTSGTETIKRGTTHTYTGAGRTPQADAASSPREGIDLPQDTAQRGSGTAGNTRDLLNRNPGGVQDTTRSGRTGTQGGTGASGNTGTTGTGSSGTRSRTGTGTGTTGTGTGTGTDTTGTGTSGTGTGSGTTGSGTTGTGTTGTGDNNTRSGNKAGSKTGTSTGTRSGSQSGTGTGSNQ